MVGGSALPFRHSSPAPDCFAPQSGRRELTQILLYDGKRSEAPSKLPSHFALHCTALQSHFDQIGLGCNLAESWKALNTPRLSIPLWCKNAVHCDLIRIYIKCTAGTRPYSAVLLQTLLLYCTTYFTAIRARQDGGSRLPEMGVLSWWHHAHRWHEEHGSCCHGISYYMDLI
jgi:hypothetical protein